MKVKWFLAFFAFFRKWVNEVMGRKRGGKGKMAGRRRAKKERKVEREWRMKGEGRGGIKEKKEGKEIG